MSNCPRCQIVPSPYRWKSTVLPGKLFFQKRPKTGFFWGHDSGVSWLWEELYAKLLGLGQLLGCPLKVWGITVQTSFWEGLWHQNCGYTSPILFFAGGHRNQWKTELFRKSLWTRKFSMGNIFGGKDPWKPYALRIHKIYMKGGYNKCLTLFWLPEVGWMRRNAVR